MLRRAFLWSCLVELTATLSMLVTFRLAAAKWGVHGLSEWVLVRRIVGLVVPFLTCGIEVSLTLLAARIVHDNRARESLTLGSGLLLVGATVCLFTGVVSLFPRSVAILFFGNAALEPLVMLVVAIAAALAMHVAVYAFLRGTMRLAAANAIHALVYGVIPVVSVLVVATGPRTAILVLAAATASVAALVSAPWLAKGVPWRALARRSFSLAIDGAPRVPGTLGLLGLFAVPPIVVAHFDGLERAAFLSLSLSVVTIAGSAFTPISFVLLPVAVRAGREGAPGFIRQFRFVSVGGLLLAVIVSGALVLLSNWVSRVLLGHDDATLSGLLRWTALAIPPYVYFVCCRSLVDARTPNATTTKLIGWALVSDGLAFVPLLLLFSQTKAVLAAVVAFVASIFVLALGVHMKVRRLFPAVAQ